MADLHFPFNSLLSKHNIKLKPSTITRQDIRDEFLKEAYRILTHLVSLHTYLLSIRQAYLTISSPPRHPPPSKTRPTQAVSYLDPPARDAIDASSKTLLRDLSASIKQLASAESVRRRTASSVLQRKYRQGWVGRWAAGGDGEGGKSEEQKIDEGMEETLSMFREGVLWDLGRRLEAVGDVQREMMERRLGREVERGRSKLYKVRGNVSTILLGETGEGGGEVNGVLKNTEGWGGGYLGAKGVQMEGDEKREIEKQLSPEQLQLFARENQDMLKGYEVTLDQVRTAERSLLEISELQTTLVQNLDIQSANISQLVAESLSTTQNVGSGNKELKRATERKSTARLVFWSSCALCGFLVGWDLIF